MIPEGKPKIIAIDFDKTLCDSGPTGTYLPIQSTIDKMNEELKKGSRFILWTCREGQDLEEALLWCEKYGIHFEAINDNVPDIVERFNVNMRKIYANEYWDDKAVNPTLNEKGN